MFHLTIHRLYLMAQRAPRHKPIWAAAGVFTALVVATPAEACKWYNEGYFQSVSTEELARCIEQKTQHTKDRLNDQFPRVAGKMTPLHLAALDAPDSTAGLMLIDAGADVKLKDGQGRTALHLAILSGGKTDLIERLIKQGADVDERDNARETPLMIAARHNRVGMVTRLIEAGADPFVRKTNKITARRIAAKANAAEAVAALVAAEADAKAHRLAAKDGAWATNVRRGGSSIAASPANRVKTRPTSERGTRPSVRQKTARQAANSRPAGAIISDGSGTLRVHKRETIDLPALLHATAAEDMKTVERLLKDGADVTMILKARTPHCRAGETALHVALRGSGKGRSKGRPNLPLAEVLIAAGANLNAMDEDGLTPLHWAATLKNPEFVTRMLEAGANVPVAKRALGTATDRSDVETMAVLLAGGADPNVGAERSLSTPLHRAGFRDSVTATKLLLLFGADPNARNRDGYTPLHTAVMNKRFDEIPWEIVDDLLAAGADPEAEADRHGTTPAGMIKAANRRAKRRYRDEKIQRFFLNVLVGLATTPPNRSAAEQEKQMQQRMCASLAFADDWVQIAAGC